VGRVVSYVGQRCNALLSLRSSPHLSNLNGFINALLVSTRHDPPLSLPDQPDIIPDDGHPRPSDNGIPRYPENTRPDNTLAK